MRIDTANVYFDHPYHAPLDHALGIDFINAADGGRERVAVELSAQSARGLVSQILAALASGEAEHGPAAEYRTAAPPVGWVELLRYPSPTDGFRIAREDGREPAQPILQESRRQFADVGHRLRQLAARQRLVAHRAQHALGGAHLDRQPRERVEHRRRRPIVPRANSPLQAESCCLRARLRSAASS